MLVFKFSIKRKMTKIIYIERIFFVILPIMRLMYDFLSYSFFISCTDSARPTIVEYSCGTFSDFAHVIHLPSIKESHPRRMAIPMVSAWPFISGRPSERLWLSILDSTHLSSSGSPLEPYYTHTMNWSDHWIIDFSFNPLLFFLHTSSFRRSTSVLHHVRNLVVYHFYKWLVMPQSWTFDHHSCSFHTLINYSTNCIYCCCLVIGPLNPEVPAEAQESTRPRTSVIVTIVLFKLAWRWIIPFAILRPFLREPIRPFLRELV